MARRYALAGCERAMTVVNGSRPTRRSRAEMQAIRDAIAGFLREQNPATDRGVFYQIETRGLIAKEEKEYKGTIVRLLGIMRRRGEIPFEWIADGTRWMRK